MSRTVPILASLAVAMLLAIAVAVAVALEPAQATFPGKNGKIAFGKRTGPVCCNYDIYRIDPSSGPIRNLTQDGNQNFSPSYSPDGRKIAFITGGCRCLYTMDASGGSQIEVDGRNYNDDPHWSPSGRKIVYAHRLRDSQFPENDWEIATANADGSRKRYLTDNLHQDFSPAWSPDGTKIAFVSDRDGDYDIYVMNADGTGPRTQLTNDPADDDSPEWSPGSKRIAFTSARVEGSSWDVYRMRADGSHQTRLTKNPAGDADPTWSPDGTKIAFTSFRNPDLGDKPRISIYVMDAARESETNVPQWLAKGYDPDWQPLP